MTLDQASPILLADTGPLIRLAAAGLLPTLRLTNRRIVIVDRVEAEATADASKPFAREIAEWIAAMGDAVERPRTLIGRALRQMEAEDASPENLRALRRASRDSGEKALREYIETWVPEGTPSALVVFEDSHVPILLQASPIPLVMMTTRRFVKELAVWGVNTDAAHQLEGISAQFTLRPSQIGEIDPLEPEDMRQLPREDGL